MPKGNKLLNKPNKKTNSQVYPHNDDKYNQKNLLFEPKNQLNTEFIFYIDTTKSGTTANNEFQLPFVSNGNYLCSVDWGDASTNVITSYNQTDTKHTYSLGGIYKIKISGIFEGWSFQQTTNPQDPNKMKKIKQWGNIAFADNGGYFNECENLVIKATDIPDTSYLTNFRYIFNGCKEIVTIPNINKWDVSNGKRFFRAFEGSSKFNSPLNDWDMRNAEDIRRMFEDCPGFNQPLYKWQTGNIKDMHGVFQNCQKFDQDLSTWNVENVAPNDFNNGFKYFLQNTSFSTQNYDKLLIEWEKQNVNTGLPFLAQAKYTSGGKAEAARNSLINNYNWSISDEGPV